MMHILATVSMFHGLIQSISTIVDSKNHLDTTCWDKSEFSSPKWHIQGKLSQFIPSTFLLIFLPFFSRSLCTIWDEKFIYLLSNCLVLIGKLIKRVLEIINSSCHMSQERLERFCHKSKIKEKKIVERVKQENPEKIKSSKPIKGY